VTKRIENLIERIDELVQKSRDLAAEHTKIFRESRALAVEQHKVWKRLAEFKQELKATVEDRAAKRK
jgi:regulator of replication initiation timing